MLPVSLTQIYKRPKLALLELAGYAALLTVMAIRSEHIGTTYLAAMACELVLCAIMPLGGFVCAVFMTIPFTAVLKLPVETFSYMTLLQLFLVVRSFIDDKRINATAFILIALGCIITQIVPFITFGQTFSNILLLIFNVLTFYCTCRLTADNRINVGHLYLAFTVGVLTAGLLSLNYNISVTEYNDYRFSGLWTDPNFWGMFCLLGIITSLMTGFRKPVLFVFLAPIIFNLAYQGFLTLSRTFIVVCALMFFAISWAYLKKTFWVNLVIVGILALAVYYGLPFAEEVFNERGFSENDVSNGRFESSYSYLRFFFEHDKALFGGLGYNNGWHVNELFSISQVITHNSYVDILCDFGIIGNLLGLTYLTCKKRNFKMLMRNIYSMQGIAFCVLLFYMGTLSMLRYAFTFLFAALFIGKSFKSNTSLQLSK